MDRIDFETHWRRSEPRVRAFLAAACSDGAMVWDLAQETAPATGGNGMSSIPPVIFLAWVISMTRFDLDPGKAQGYVAELMPGEHERARVVFGMAGNSVWALEKGAVLTAGRCTVTAVLTVNQKLSEWKGEITTGMLEIEIPEK